MPRSIRGTAVDDIIDLGRAWYAQHGAHVDRLATEFGPVYEPTGSDAYRPELWKPAHWRWFKQQLARNS